MDLILSHNTAFMYWRSFTGRRFFLEDSPRCLAMTERVTITEVIHEELETLGIAFSARRPLHLLFAAPALRPHDEQRARLRGELDLPVTE